MLGYAVGVQPLAAAALDSSYNLLQHRFLFLHDEALLPERVDWDLASRWWICCEAGLRVRPL